MDMSRNSQQSSGSGVNIGLLPILIFGVLIVVGGILLSTFTPSLFPPAASAEAQPVDDLFRTLLLIGGAIFLLVQGLLVYAVIAHRAKPGDTSDGAHTHGNMTLEIVWTVIPAVIVTFLSILSYNVWVETRNVNPNENLINGQTVPISLVGQRFAWSFDYDTGEANIEGDPIHIRSGSVLHTYVGQNVHLTMNTADVIHSLWIPAMRVKQDLLPGPARQVLLDEEGSPVLDENGAEIVLAEGGRTTDIRFTPVEPAGGLELVDEATGFRYGEYAIVCAELCGDGHGNMRGTVVVWESEEAFLTSFYQPSVAALFEPPKDPVIRGEAVIQTYACAGCHALDSLGWQGITGPRLNGIADRAGARVAGETAEEYLVHSIYESGRYLAPGFGNLMPIFGPEAASTNQMSPENLYAIVAYLCTQTASGDPADSSCDLENLGTTIPAIVERDYGYTVDVDFGGAAAETTPEAPGAESTAEAPAPEATAEATAEAGD